MSDETVQQGHQYPNVVRVLKPGSEEYDWYNSPTWDGSAWPGPSDSLTWAEPTERADGSPIRPISTYTIEYGGVDTVTSAGICTSCEPENFFSHRRDRGNTGRQAGIAWVP